MSCRLPQSEPAPRVTSRRGHKSQVTPHKSQVTRGTPHAPSHEPTDTSHKSRVKLPTPLVPRQRHTLAQATGCSASCARAQAEMRAPQLPYLSIPFVCLVPYQCILCLTIVSSAAHALPSLVVAHPVGSRASTRAVLCEERLQPSERAKGNSRQRDPRDQREQLGAERNTSIGALQRVREAMPAVPASTPSPPSSSYARGAHHLCLPPHSPWYTGRAPQLCSPPKPPLIPQVQ